MIRPLADDGRDATASGSRVQEAEGVVSVQVINERRADPVGGRRPGRRFVDLDDAAAGVTQCTGEGSALDDAEQRHQVPSEHVSQIAARPRSHTVKMHPAAGRVKHMARPVQVVTATPRP